MHHYISLFMNFHLFNVTQILRYTMIQLAFSKYIQEKMKTLILLPKVVGMRETKLKLFGKIEIFIKTKYVIHCLNTVHQFA